MFPRFANPAIQLGAFRVAVYVTLLCVVDPRIAAHYAAYPDVLLAPPGFWRGVLECESARHAWQAMVSVESVWVAYAAFIPACAMAMAGYRARWTQIIAIVSGGFVLSIAQFYGKVNHYNHLLWFAMLLAASPCADALAIDARRANERAHVCPRDAYGLPLRFVWALLVVIYFFPGLWKAVSVGTPWAESSNVVGILHAKWAETGHVPWMRLDRWSWLCGVIGVSTMVFELAFAPLTLAGTWPRRAAVVFGVLFHMGIWVAMDIRIGHVLVGYLALVDVSRWLGPRADVRSALAASTHVPRQARYNARWPVCAIGAALIAGNIYDGATRRDDWPLGMYPAFAWRAPADHVTLEITAEFPDGTKRVLTPLDLARFTTPERAAATCNAALHEDAMRPTRQRALWHVWCAQESTLERATRVRFERVARQVKPEALGMETERLVVGSLSFRPD